MNKCRLVVKSRKIDWSQVNHYQEIKYSFKSQHRRKMYYLKENEQLVFFFKKHCWLFLWLLPSEHKANETKDNKNGSSLFAELKLLYANPVWITKNNVPTQLYVKRGRSAPALWKMLHGPWNSNSPFAVQYYSPYVKEYKTVLDSGSHSVDCGFRVLDSSLFQWNVDSGFHALVGFWSTLALFWIPKPWVPVTTSKIFPDFAFYKQRISQILESGYP